MANTPNTPVTYMPTATTSERVRGNASKPLSRVDPADLRGEDESPSQQGRGKSTSGS